jgi:hypothetical protein
MIEVFRFNYATEGMEVIAEFPDDQVAEAGEFARLAAGEDGLLNPRFGGGGGRITGEWLGKGPAPYYGIARGLDPSVPRVAFELKSAPAGVEVTQ